MWRFALLLVSAMVLAAWTHGLSGVGDLITNAAGDLLTNANGDLLTK